LLRSTSPIPNPRKARGRWDAAETANYYNLAALDAGVDLALRIGAETVAAHNHKLIDLLFSRLPQDRFVVASPSTTNSAARMAASKRAARKRPKSFTDKLRKENVITSLREGKIRVSPYMYNNERDIDRLISVVTV